MIRIALIFAASAIRELLCPGHACLLYPVDTKVSLSEQLCWHLCQEEGLGCPRLVPQAGLASVNFKEGDVTKNGSRNKVSVMKQAVLDLGQCIGVGGGVEWGKKGMVGERSVIFKAYALLECPQRRLSYMLCGTLPVCIVSHLVAILNSLSFISH